MCFLVCEVGPCHYEMILNETGSGRQGVHWVGRRQILSFKGKCSQLDPG